MRGKEEGQRWTSMPRMALYGKDGERMISFSQTIRFYILTLVLRELFYSSVYAIFTHTVLSRERKEGLILSDAWNSVVLSTSDAPDFRPKTAQWNFFTGEKTSILRTHCDMCSFETNILFYRLFGFLKLERAYQRSHSYVRTGCWESKNPSSWFTNEIARAHLLWWYISNRASDWSSFS